MTENNFRGPRVAMEKVINISIFVRLTHVFRGAFRFTHMRAFIYSICDVYYR